MPQRHVSTTHSISTFTVSRERQKPASSIVKPTCMPNTRNAATSVQVVFTGLTMSPGFTVVYGSGGVAGVAGATGVAGAVLVSAVFASGVLMSGVFASGAF